MGAKLRWLVPAVAVAALGGLVVGSASAGHPSYGVSFRTPHGWTRVNWCWTGVNVEPIALLTTARPAPRCTKPTAGVGVSFPPVERLGRNGVGVALALEAIFPGEQTRWNTRVDGRPAYVSVSHRRADAACGAGIRADVRHVGFRRPRFQNTMFTAVAVICGPDLAAGETAFRRILRSVRFTS